MLIIFIIGISSGIILASLFLIPRIYISFKTKVLLEQRIKLLEKKLNNDFNKIY